MSLLEAHHFISAEVMGEVGGADVDVEITLRREECEIIRTEGGEERDWGREEERRGRRFGVVGSMWKTMGGAVGGAAGEDEEGITGRGGGGGRWEIKLLVDITLSETLLRRIMRLRDLCTFLEPM